VFIENFNSNQCFNVNFSTYKAIELQLSTIVFKNLILQFIKDIEACENRPNWNLTELLSPNASRNFICVVIHVIHQNLGTGRPKMYKSRWLGWYYIEYWWYNTGVICFWRRLNKILRYVRVLMDVLSERPSNIFKIFTKKWTKER